MTKTYVMGETTIRALTDINLSVEKGELLSVVGPSGSGKTTLLNMLGALDRPTSGRVIIDGVDITEVPDRSLYRLRRDKVGFIFQRFYMIPTLTALENVLIPTLPIRGDKVSVLERARRLLQEVGLGERMSHRPNQLSGGELQRVAIARSLINEPEILLCDEITGELDTKTGMDIVELLKTVNREEHVTMLFVTHDRDVAVATNRVVTLSDGRMISDQPK